MQLLLTILLLTSCGSGGGGSYSTQDKEGGSLNEISVAKNISPDSTDSFNSKIAADAAGNVYAAWEENGGLSGTRIFLSKSVNSGDTFDRAIDIKSYCSGSGDISRDVNLITGGDGHTYIAWAEEWPALNNISDVKFFTEKEYLCGPVSNTFSSKESVYSPMIQLNADRKVQMVWAQGKSGNTKDIFYKQNTQKNPVNLSNTPLSDSSDPHYPTPVIH